MRSFLILASFFFFVQLASAQNQVKKVLFLGNSYTFANDLPLLVAGLADSNGDSLIYDANTPGGYTLGWEPIAHATNPESLGLISSGSWDYVVLQEQSQTPAIPALRDSCMFPGANILNDSVKQANPCSHLLFYLTWGRRFGGTQCFTPNYCSTDFTDFDHMQDSLTVAYKMISDSLNATVAPVGEAWRYVLSNTSMLLHSSDNSHPNLNGSYLAACVFYATIFKQPSSGLPFTAGLDPDSALILQEAADSIVFGFASTWNLWINTPQALFQTHTSGDTLFTQNLSTNAFQWRWNFGDGNTSSEFEPMHIYEVPGTYIVSLVACDSCSCDSLYQMITIIQTSVTNDQPLEEPIHISGPDREGYLLITGFDQEGFCMFYNLSGQFVAQTIANKGKAKIPATNNRILLVLVYDTKGAPIVSGKLFPGSL
jgi:hypothetical protein